MDQHYTKVLNNTESKAENNDRMIDSPKRPATDGNYKNDIFLVLVQETQVGEALVNNNTLKLTVHQGSSYMILDEKSEKTKNPKIWKKSEKSENWRPIDLHCIKTTVHPPGNTLGMLKTSLMGCSYRLRAVLFGKIITTAVHIVQWSLFQYFQPLLCIYINDQPAINENCL